MKKLSLISLGILASLQFTKAQVISSKKWADLFSYNNVLAMKEDNGKIIAATENGIFYYTIATGEITKLSKANGLHNIGITAFDYDPKSKTGVIGYQNGAIDVVTPNEIKYIVDIPIATGYNGNKKINHISITGDRATISVGYGVSIFNIKKKEFIDSAFFLNGGTFEASNEATIFGNKVYSVTNSGLRSHEINNTFPAYSTWVTEVPGAFKHIDSESELAFSSATAAFIYNNGAPIQLPINLGNIQDVVVTESNVIVTDSRVYTFGLNGTSSNATDFGEQCNTATMASGKLFGGTVLSGIKDESNHTYKPSGPEFNFAYKINLYDNNQLLISTGARNGRYNGAVNNPKKPAFYYFNGTEWIYPSYFKTFTGSLNVLDAILSPLDNSEVLFTNYTMDSQGIYKLKYNASNKDFDFVKYYAVQATPFQRRAVGLATDAQNNIFAVFSFNDGGPAVAIYDKAKDDFNLKISSFKSASVQKPIIYENMLWIPLSRSNAFWVYDYKDPLNFSDDTDYILDEKNGLPSNATGTLSVAADKSGDVWISTDKGIRVLSNAATIKAPEPKVNPIIIEQNGIGEELFRDSSILQIETDGGNYKWVSVDGGGVYYLSADGQRTIKHFTMENSPLPTNTVTDIKVDKKTGKVYFVTYNGIVTYQGDITDVTSNFGEVMVYPNPVIYSNFKGKVTIKGLAEKTNIRIVDAAGNVVHSAVARGGIYEWDLNNQRGARVASGIYFVLMTNEDGSDKATAKIGVVN
ncbi:T9SS type A sorting domain-containing protein [Chryseobacterium rhizoplanae]|uniref:type IX secretion system anionic LPS delivery protein PorZ n=1 Tax=Chryseobacterium rhizoplanae TaxID=1609531 RepID=UPI001CE33246|nr:T9SS type A sorting domain-containing protein [Chryseobacterium rhizoplanae]UCA59311.1 T9SS type A sorting domain-containing protein [Chryseobacterium rhizoplanae]